MNIQKNAFRKGEYTWRDPDGSAWIIRRSSSSFGSWVAYTDNQRKPMVFAFRLKDLEQRLEAQGAV